MLSPVSSRNAGRAMHTGTLAHCPPERFVVGRILGSHDLVPPREIESEVGARPGMVQVVMRDRGDPVEERATVGRRRKDLVAAVPDRIPQHHVRREDEGGEHAGRHDRHHDQQIDRVDECFAGVEGIGGPGCRIVRAVMQAVEPPEEFWTVHDPMGPVEPCIVRDDQYDDVDDEIGPSILRRVFIDGQQSKIGENSDREPNQ